MARSQAWDPLRPRAPTRSTQHGKLPSVKHFQQQHGWMRELISWSGGAGKHSCHTDDDHFSAPQKNKYHTFLDKLKLPSAQSVVNEVRDFVQEFPANLTRLQAARRIHEYVSASTERLLATDTPLEDSPEESRQTAEEGLEKFIVLKLHKLLYRHAQADISEDERVDRCIKSSELGKLPRKLVKETEVLFEEAAQELRKLDQYRAPRDKVICMLNACLMVDNLVQSELKRQSGNEKQLFDEFLLALVVKANPPNLYSNIEFVSAFRHPSRWTEQEKNYLGKFRQAVAQVSPVENSLDGVTRNGAGGAATAGGTDAAGSPVEELSPWLTEAGITFRFEGCSPENILLGEVDELLEEYQRMARVLRGLGRNGAKSS